MVFYEANIGECTLIFMAGFHLGIPLAISQTRKSLGWSEIKKELSDNFSNHCSHFELVSFGWEEANFPVGNPLAIRFLNFFDVFNAEEYLKAENLLSPTDQCKLNHLIWICPTGVVLLIGTISCDSRCNINLNQLETIVEKHYAELAYIFTEIVEVVAELFSDEILSSSICCANVIQKWKKCISMRKQLTDYSAILSWLKNNDEAHVLYEDVLYEDVLYEDILFDVYYIDFLRSRNGTKHSIDYRDARIESSDPLYLLMISIAYSSFVSFLWLQQHLGEQSRILQEGLMDVSPMQKGISSELKVFRIFCLQFINESNPINIRLTREYMICLEECWNEYRMKALVDQVSDQLETLEKMFDWVEEVKKEGRNYR